VCTPGLFCGQAALASEAEFKTALQLTTDIFRQAGIRIVWIQCDASNALPPSSPGECEQPPTAGELIMRLTEGPRVPRPLRGVAVATDAGRVLGDSYVGRQPGGGALATVYWDRVKDLGRHTGVGMPAVLGRAMAHEIGHLLLGAHRHSNTGLMRGVWSPETLRRDHVTDWRFSEEEADLMRDTVTSLMQR
jgi:hypothetical protein